MRSRACRLVLAVAALTLAAPAKAGLTERDLARVRLEITQGSRTPSSITFRDLQGRPATIDSVLRNRPALLLPVDYTCRTICGPALSIAASSLGKTGLRPGSDYRLIVVGIDPKDGPADEETFLRDRLGEPEIAAATTVLAGDDRAVGALTAALGYEAVYDAENDQFAHPSAALALTPDGRIARVLSALALDPRDLRLALVEAGEGRIGGVGDRLTLLCYGFDPINGIYTPAIRRILQGAGVLTVVVLVLLLAGLHRRARAETP